MAIFAITVELISINCHRTSLVEVTNVVTGVLPKWYLPF